MTATPPNRAWQLVEAWLDEQQFPVSQSAFGRAALSGKP